ncbi:hypothetical protein PsorP6_014427 [Peronosclerospora sorghi]|uniref:Uncharacterized protein n=1 Tax=Peronosclerospora sorghi TaxID=230839 RepID=A0ACC0VIQ2_9STRA|nr:hypothetical protein PsorP6_014427 [Peronosclerospora sorghi]
MKEPLMQFYVRGLPSSTIIVKNIPQAMDEKDLRSVFGYVLPMDMPFDSMKIKFLPRKGSAQVTYTSETIAAAAVDALHGICVEKKPLIVNFRKAPLAIPKWTFQDLESERMPEAELAFEKAMKNYQQGESSDTLYVKNLSKSVNIEDLFAVFGAVMPPEFGLDDLEIRHFTVGRMKGQAFIKYPTAQLASNALVQVHGVMLKKKPLVIVRACYILP